jgi:hypothetical protein
MRVVLFLLLLYGIDWYFDATFGQSAWSQRWGNTLSVSQRPANPPKVLIVHCGVAALQEMPSQFRVILTPALTPPLHSGTALVYSILVIRC